MSKRKLFRKFSMLKKKNNKPKKYEQIHIISCKNLPLWLK